MKVLGAQEEFIDYGFRPRILHDAGGDYLKYINNVAMKLAGMQAPSMIVETDEKEEEAKKAAVWIGARPDPWGEIPVVAVLAVSPKWENNPHTAWYVGVATPASISRRAKQIDSVSPREAAILEFASHPVRDREGDLANGITALDLLMVMHPRIKTSRWAERHSA